MVNRSPMVLTLQHGMYQSQVEIRNLRSVTVCGTLLDKLSTIIHIRFVCYAVFFLGHVASLFIGGGWWFMVFHAPFNNISVISWWSVLLVEETGVPRENH